MAEQDARPYRDVSNRWEEIDFACRRARERAAERVALSAADYQALKRAWAKRHREVHRGDRYNSVGEGSKQR